MSIKRHNPKRDANEPEIVDALQAVGAVVYRLDTPLDLIAAFHGITYLLEVKTRTGTLTDSQKDFFETWHGGPAGIVRTVEEALQFIGAINAES